MQPVTLEIDIRNLAYQVDALREIDTLVFPTRVELRLYENTRGVLRLDSSCEQLSGPDSTEQNAACCVREDKSFAAAFARQCYK